MSNSVISGTQISVKGKRNSTITFDDTSKGVSFSYTAQVWIENEMTFINNKSSSTNNVTDYSKPVRLYVNSEVIVEVERNISKIVYDCASSSYATALKNSIGDNVEASSDKVTVTFTELSNSFTIAKLTGGQVRVDSITVTYVTN